MEKEPNPNEREKSIEDIDFSIVSGSEKDDQLKEEVVELLHEYPDQFIHDLFEEQAEEDFNNSDVALAHDDGLLVGSLMFDRSKNEFNWLATRRAEGIPKLEIAKKLFESFYTDLEGGEKVHLYVNTEDATAPGHSDLGEKSEPARNLYRYMGLELKRESIIKDHYGPGSHVYKVTWVPIEKKS